MSWIKKIDYDQATGKLKRIYDRVKGPDNYIDNILKIHGLRPHTLEGHMSLYKNVLHHNGNTLPKWLLEAMGAYVSYLNNCDYCFQHHFTGMKRLLKDHDKSEKIKKGILADTLESVFESNQLMLFDYAKMLTKHPGSINETIITELKAVGYDDGEILEINQVISYFAYANRVVLGLGVSTKGDKLGLSPSDETDEKNWYHK